MDTVYQIINWLVNWTGVLARRLGRHTNFDVRSRNYPAITTETERQLKNKMWGRTLPPLQQGKLGSCTGNAIVGLLATEPNCSDGVEDDIEYSQELAVQIYSLATEADPFPWTYPPTDKGSSILSAMQVAKDMGLIREYRWCFGLEDVLIALSNLGPVAVGLDWYEGFRYPDCNGLVELTGKKTGGHAFQLIGIDIDKKVVWAVNSWGRWWGKQGRFCIKFEDLDRLLKDDGEAVMVLVD